mmetsp:Transcript_45066/g.101436  ORF Transcript_45066/g.101436 Transcript_45066/m.101436 type:complete len:101 (+) Transcript_45066:160-462(+)
MYRAARALAARSARSAPPRPPPSGRLPETVQWALTVGLATVIPGYCLWKCFFHTGAVEADRGVQEEFARRRKAQAATEAAAEAAAGARPPPQQAGDRATV